MHRHRITVSSWLAGWIVVVAAGPAPAQKGTVRVSVDSAAAEGNDASLQPAISADGRYVAFASLASNLVAGDKNGYQDIFVHDRATGVTELVSVDSAGKLARSYSNAPSISADGRFVAFESTASNLVANDVNGKIDVFVHDRLTGTTEIVSVDSAGNAGDGDSQHPFISADGRFVVFSSAATTLVSGDANGHEDAFLHDRQTGTTELVSLDSAGAQGDADSYAGSISADGRFVTIDSYANDLVAGDTNNHVDVFLRDRSAGTTERVSVDAAGAEGDQNSFDSMISADGTCVTFSSSASNLVPNDLNNYTDVFVRDLAAGTIELVSKNSLGVEGNDYSFPSTISADGRRIAFMSMANNLVAGDKANHMVQDFLHDRQTGITTLVSITNDGHQGDSHSGMVAISADGRFTAFDSFASNMVAGDNNAKNDVFVRGPWLTLEADPPAPPAGATLTFTTFTGLAAAPSLLVVTKVNGVAMFVPVVVGTFDALGTWSLAATVPSGLSGVDASFKTVGFTPTGKVDLSNGFEVVFQ